jgi:hypothetical protein
MTEIVLNQFAGQSWLITPAALAVEQRPPETMLDQEWLLVPSGGGGNLQGNSNARKPRLFLPSNSLSLGIGPSEGPLRCAISRYSNSGTVARPEGL